jgi:hypothetical protein
VIEKSNTEKKSSWMGERAVSSLSPIHSCLGGTAGEFIIQTSIAEQRSQAKETYYRDKRDLI